MTNLRPALLLPLLALALAFTACQKDNSGELSEAEARQVMEDYYTAEAMFSGAYDEVDREAQREEDLNDLQGEEPPTPVDDRGNCPVVTFTTTPNTIWPAVLTLDYSAGCTTPGGHTAAGTIVATFNGLLGQEGTSISVDFDSYVHEGFTLTGTYLVTNAGLDAQDRRVIVSEIIDGQLTGPLGNSIQHNSVRTSTMVAGQHTNFFTHGILGILDDSWSTSVQAEGIGVNGNAYTVQTLQDVVDPVSCRWPVSGEVELAVPANDASLLLDYGSNTCDNKATLTWNGVSWEIEL